MKSRRLLFFFIALSTVLSSQESIFNKKDLNNFYEIRQAFLAVIKEPEEPSGFPEDDEMAKFKRWEYIVEPRVYPSGNLPKPDCLKSAWDEYKRTHPSLPLNSRSKKWTSLEPEDGFPFNGNSGRVNCLAFHPSDTNIIFIGTPAGGLWKSTNGGKTWNSLTDQIPAIGVSEIAINPVNPDIIYIGTGDKDAANFISNPYSYGILKSTNGGLTWDTTGLQFLIQGQMSVSRLIINPKNPNILLAAVKSDQANFKGVWRSEDAGAHWTNVSGGAKYDIEFHPSNPDIVYTCGYKNIQKSKDGGKTWTVISSSNLPLASDITSSKIAVTIASPNDVYVAYLNAQDGYTYGMYKSMDAGDSWSVLNTFRINTQSAYDFDFAVSPIDTNLIVLGGQQAYFSNTEGRLFSQRTEGHLDHHGYYFRNGTNSLYDCNDGGLYLSHNVMKTWINLNKGLQTFQYYRLACSQLDNDFILTGAQDNGCLSHRYPNWQQIFGADGMECAIDPTDDQIYYSSYQYGNFVGWGSVSQIFTPPPGAGSSNYAWVTPFIIHPKNPKTLFAGGRDIFISKDHGANWVNYSTNLTQNDPVGGGFLRGMAISPSNPDEVMYAISYVVVYKTADGGKTWKPVTSNLPTTAGCLDCSALSSILIHPEHPDTAWVTMSGYSKTNKVYQTTDGGLNWTNISGTLPAVPVNTIVYERDNDDALYIGTDIGVFYKNNKMPDWQPFMDGLPKVPIQELEIVEPFHKIRAATFGRGLWEAALRDVQVSDKNIKNKEADRIELFPNPGLNHITVKLNYLKENMRIHLFDSRGVELLSKPLYQLVEEIEIPNSSEKMIYYKIVSKNKSLQSGLLYVK
jgi:photosystem II stability/assembly factor-like uncharacterized protein